MANWDIFLTIAVVASAVFVIQFIMSIFIADVDMDVDLDSDIGSMISFKGLIHFAMGFGWYMYLANERTVLQYAIAIAIGLFFVVVVWYLYRMAARLQQTNKPEQPSSLVGRECIIYFNQGGGRYLVHVEVNGSKKERAVISETANSYKTGETVVITKYENGKLFI